MNRFVAAVSQVSALLRKIKVPYALIGGLAVSARTEPRFTRDVDFAVAVNEDKEAEKLVKYFTGRGYAISAIVEHEEKMRLATVRLVKERVDDLEVVVDLLFASSGIEQEIAEAAEMIEVWGSVVLPVAVVGHLIALKLLAQDDLTRPQDSIDLHALLTAADDRELERARKAVLLIAERGFNRGKNLPHQLEKILQEADRT